MLLAGYSAHAADAIWTGNSALNGNWGTGANWLGGIAPGATSGLNSQDMAWFINPIANGWGSTAGVPVVIDAPAQNVGGLSFSGNAAPYFIGTTAGNSLFLTSGGTTQIGVLTNGLTGVTETIAAPLVLAGNNSTHTFANQSASSGANSGLLVLSGAIGAGPGAATLMLAGTNTGANVVSGEIGNGVADSLALVKSGAGSWALTNSNTYTGATTVTGAYAPVGGAPVLSGTLALGSATVSSGSILGSTAVAVKDGATLNLINTAGNADRLADTAALTLSRGGTLILTQNNTTNTTETLGGLTVDRGSSIVTVSSTTNRTPTLNASSLSRTNSGFLLVRGNNLGQPTATVNHSRIILGDGGASLGMVGTNSLNNAASSDSTQSLRIVPHLIGDVSTTGNGSNFVTYDATLGLRVLTAAQGTVLTSGSTTNVAAPVNAVVSGTSTTPITLTEPALTVNSLLMSNSGGSTLNGSSTLTINSGAIITTGGATTIGSGLTIVLGNGQGIISGGNGTLTTNSPIQVAGGGNLVKGGTAGLTYNAANTMVHAGDTIVAGGVLTVGVASVMNSYTGNVVVEGGEFRVSGNNSAYTGTVTVKAGIFSLQSGGSFDGGTILLGDTAGDSPTQFLNAVSNSTKPVVVQSGNTGTAAIYVQINSALAYYDGQVQLGSTGGTGHGISVHTTGVSNNVNGMTGPIVDPANMVPGTAGLVTIHGGVATKNTSVFGNAGNAYTGGTALSGGFLSISKNGGVGNWFGLGPLTINGGSLNQLTASPVTVTGIASLVLNNTLAHAGTAVTFTAPVNLGGTGGDIARVIHTTAAAASPLTLGGGLQNGTNDLTKAVIKTGTGKLVLFGASTYTSGTTIVGGSLETGDASALGMGPLALAPTGSVALATNGSSLQVGSLSTSIAPPTFTAGTGTGSSIQKLVITGGGGSGAAGTATIVSGQITAVSITDYGRDYTSAPTFTLSNPAASNGTITPAAFAQSTIDVGAGTLTILGNNPSPAVYTGTIAGVGGSLIKNGAGVQTLASVGGNSFTGATTVNGGTLTLQGALSGTTAVTIAGGGLVLGAAERINDASTVALTGGTLDIDGHSETLGALTLGGVTAIDFGIGAGPVTLSFASASASWSGSLSILEWGATDHLFIGTSNLSLTADQLGRISFVNPEHLAPGVYGATILGTGEVVAVPEPAAALALSLGAVGLLAGRRRARREHGHH